MGLSSRIGLRLSVQEHGLLAGFSRDYGQTTAAAARFLLVRALTRDPDQTLLAAALAALVAAEHAALMVASIIPDGEDRLLSLADMASEAAQRRLASFTEPPDSEL